MIELFRAGLARAAAIVRRVIGAPDYEGYLAHVRERHPECTPLSREQFTMASLRARYDKPGSRCC
jgi:uncharacterized short protein YbdD (DUF466 family)